VRALVTDMGTFEKRAGALELVALAPGVTFAAVQERCAWRLAESKTDLPVLAEPTADEIAALRSWDPRGWFLRS
jgi:acyl CoA:acetate/3-ketoacid CoA transferase beta subunit